MAEDYVRPPLHVDEPRSPRAGNWRFRLFFALVLLAIIVGAFFLIRWLAGGTNDGSGVVMRPVPHVSPGVSAAQALRT